MRKLSAALAGALALIACLPAASMAAPVNVLPAIQGPNGPVMADPVVNIGKDSITSLPCVVGFTTTCVLLDAGGGGGTASLAPWTPDNGSLTTAAPTSSSSLSTAFTGLGTTIYVKNVGNAAIHVRPVLTSGTALVTDERLLPGMCGPFARGTADRLALITDGGTGSVEITTGTGNPGFGICTDLSTASLVRPDPATTTSRITSAAASTNATSAKASSGTLLDIQGYNAATSVRYLKIYNKATSPTVGTDTPVKTLALPPSAAFAFDWPNGYLLTTGLAYALTTGPTDGDTGALSSADVTGLNLDYK